MGGHGRRRTELEQVRGRPDTAELENLSTILFLVHLSLHMAARLGLSRVAPRLLKARRVTSAIRAYATQSEHTVRHPLPQCCRVLIFYKCR